MFAIRLVIVLAVLSPFAQAQDLGLAGYGGTSSSSMMGSSSRGIPYSGIFGGFMPYRMRGSEGSSLGFATRPSRLGYASRRPFRLSDSGEMGRKPWFSTFGDAMSSPSGRPSMSVMPPNFGYPFRVPPSLADSGAPSMGMP